MFEELDQRLTLVPPLAARTQLPIDGVQAVVDGLHGNLAHYIFYFTMLENALNFKRSNTIHKKAANP